MRPPFISITIIIPYSMDMSAGRRVIMTDKESGNYYSETTVRPIITTVSAVSFHTE